MILKIVEKEQQLQLFSLLKDSLNKKPCCAKEGLFKAENSQLNSKSTTILLRFQVMEKWGSFKE
jgi:hypothetical protein